MGVSDNMVHTESSKVTSLSNGNHPEERQVLQKGPYAGPNGLLKFKRRRVSVVRDFPPGCGPSSVPFRLQLGLAEVREGDTLESIDEKGVNVRENGDKAEDFVRCSESKAEPSSNEELVRQGDTLESIDEKGVNVGLSERIDSQHVNKMQLIVIDSNNPNFTPEDTETEGSNEPVDARPLSVCLPVSDSEPSNISQACRVSKEAGSADRQQMGLSKTIKNGKKVSAARDFPLNTGRKSTAVQEKSVRVKVKMNGKMRNTTENTVRVHTDERIGRVVSHQSLSKDTSEEDIGTGIVPIPKQIAAADRRKSKKVVTTREFDVGLPPLDPSGASSMNGSRSKVKETLRLFHLLCRKILQEQEGKPRDEKNGNKRVDFHASKILKDKGRFVNTGKQIMGSVPGVEVGDEFQYRMELNMIGLHRPSQGGIDYVKEGGQLYATSIVASGGYDNELDNTDILIYTGQGGNVMNGGKEPEDQKLERGNLALANSKQRRNPVRVIRGHSRAVDSSEARGRAYVYDGLYIVETFWQETGPHGKLVFKYKLQRIPGQPELSWKVVTKSKKSKFRDGLCRLDISEGKERLPICAVNSVDDEQPPSFIYTVGMIYPDWCKPIPPKGCDCTTRCSDERKCCCVSKNDRGLPYNSDGALVEILSLVYECGPRCKCPPSCYNRVTQRGIKFQLEIFKTVSRGWGVRSLNSIPSGSFICEYAGELLEDTEAERRTGHDEYLFDIGHNYDNSLRDGMRELMPEAYSGSDQTVEESGQYTIDAGRYGNIGRFINHSCSPNLYAQNVLFDHEDKRIPHVMFFALDNIPALQELTYDYHYIIGQVRDSNGNIKRKDCYCGSSDCKGRLY